MNFAIQANFISPRIQARFEESANQFLEEANYSMAAHAVVAHLFVTESDKRYATGDRNKCVRQLANDVETFIGTHANLLFRSSSTLHNSLQTLMDAYEDAMDGIYYVDPEVM